MKKESSNTNLNYQEQLIEKNISSLIKSAAFREDEGFIDASFKRVKSKITQKRTIFSISRNSMKYAAVITLLIALNIFTYFYFQDGNNLNSISYNTLAGNSSSIRLSDGSEITLNANSSVTITECNTNTNVILTGEAYFDIIHNEERTFLVNVEDLTIKDLGTVFNVKAYPEDEIISTSLSKGNIDLLDVNNKVLANINPGENAIYNKRSKKLNIKETDVSVNMAWKEGKFVFINKTLADISNELAKWYNIEINIADAKMASERYTCVLKRTTTITEVLEIFKTIADINYTITKENEKNVILITNF